MLTPFKVTKEMLDKTENNDVIFMHCLPSFHDFDTTMAKEQMDLGYDIREVTDEVHPVQTLQGVRRSREQNAHHQSGYGCDYGLIEI